MGGFASPNAYSLTIYSLTFSLPRFFRFFALITECGRTTTKYL